MKWVLFHGRESYGERRRDEASETRVRRERSEGEVEEPEVRKRAQER